MTFDEYINNPMGIKNSVISNREMYRQLYSEKLDKLTLREAGKIEYKTYKGNKGKYYCYMKIPSEVVDDVYYDVIVEFSKPNKNKILDSSLKDYEVRFFSNDPSFMFSFCHAFIKNKMFITEYSDKMAKEARTKRGVEKNPKDIIGYVKSLYFMYLIMKRKGLFNKQHYVETYNESRLKKGIDTSEHKLQERQDKAKTSSKQNKASKNNLKRNISSKDKTETPTTFRIRNTPITKTISSKVKKTNIARSTKRSKTI